MRNIIDEVIESSLESEFYTLSEAIIYLSELEEKNKDKYTTMYLDVTVEYFPYSSDTYATISLRGEREETLEEEQERFIKDKKYAEREKERELAELAKLKAKYEDS